MLNTLLSLLKATLFQNPDCENNFVLESQLCYNCLMYFVFVFVPSRFFILLLSGLSRASFKIHRDSFSQVHFYDFDL